MNILEYPQSGSTLINRFGGANMVKVGKKCLKMSSGKIKCFKSEEARDKFEKVAAAYAHGWKGPKGRR